MKTLKKMLGSSILILIFSIIVFNISLYYQPDFKTYGDHRINQDLIHQLRHLKKEMRKSAALQMQRIYPEGFVFLNVLYGLSWVEVAQRLNPDNELYTEANSEINWVLAELSSVNGLRVFSPKLEPAYGIFYRGWTNYLLGRKLMLFPPSQRDTIELALFQQNCKEIMLALSNQESPYLESYSRACWPADMVVAMASVKMHSILVDPYYEEEIKSWVQNVRGKTDTLGLIPHSGKWESGETLEPSRGSSQSLILNFLIEIDEEFAKEQFEIYKGNFLDHRLGLPGIREYPEDVDGFGDIDSGPVIWGIGGAASVVGQRTMAIFSEPTIAVGIRNSIETFGFGISVKGRKRYLLGKLPIADAFIAWSNSIEAYDQDRLSSERNWRFQFQMISLALILIGGFLVFRIW